MVDNAREFKKGSGERREKNESQSLIIEIAAAGNRGSMQKRPTQSIRNAF